MGETNPRPATDRCEEIRRVLAPQGVLAVNSTFYSGAYPEESKPFYSRWMRRAIAEMNQRLPNRAKSEKVQHRRLPSPRTGVPHCAN